MPKGCNTWKHSGPARPMSGSASQLGLPKFLADPPKKWGIRTGKVQLLPPLQAAVSLLWHLAARAPHLPPTRRETETHHKGQTVNHFYLTKKRRQKEQEAAGTSCRIVSRGQGKGQALHPRLGVPHCGVWGGANLTSSSHIYQVSGASFHKRQKINIMVGSAYLGGRRGLRVPGGCLAPTRPAAAAAPAAAAPSAAP